MTPNSLESIANDVLTLWSQSLVKICEATDWQQREMIERLVDWVGAVSDPAKFRNRVRSFQEQLRSVTAASAVDAGDLLSCQQRYYAEQLNLCRRLLQASSLRDTQSTLSELYESALSAWRVNAQIARCLRVSRSSTRTMDQQ